MNRVLRSCFVLTLSIPLLTACGKAGESPPPAAPAAAAMPVSERLDVCLRLPAGSAIQGRRAVAGADTATLRHAGGTLEVYVGPAPDYPGFRGATRRLPDTVTPAFQPIADTTRAGMRHVLYGHKRQADQPRVYVMLSGAEAAFTGGAAPAAGDFVDCGS